MQKNQPDIIKWLKILLYVQIAGFVISLISFLPIHTNWYNWLHNLSDLGIIVCLFALASQKTYRTAAIFGSVQLALTLLQNGIQFYALLMMAQNVLSTDDLTKYNEIAAAFSLVAMVVNWVYIYQLYHAHGDLVKDLDYLLNRKWRALFVWTLVVGIATSVSSMVFATAYMEMGMDSQEVLNIFYKVIEIPGNLIILLSVIYLHRTIQTLQKQESMTYGN